MKLKELLTGISVLECTADPELEIKEIFYDSRKVTPGSLFVAVSGFAADGNKFIPMAAERVRRRWSRRKSRRGMFPMFWWRPTGWRWRCWDAISLAARRSR